MTTVLKEYSYVSAVTGKEVRGWSASAIVNGVKIISYGATDDEAKNRLDRERDVVDQWEDFQLKYGPLKE